MTASQTYKQQSHCDIFRQRDVEMIDRAYNNWFSIKTLTEEFKPLFFLLDSLICNFFYYN